MTTGKFDLRYVTKKAAIHQFVQGLVLTIKLL